MRKLCGILAVILLLTLCAAAFTACGGEGNDKKTNENQTASEKNPETKGEQSASAPQSSSEKPSEPSATLPDASTYEPHIEVGGTGDPEEINWDD